MPKAKLRLTCKAFLEIGNGEKAAEGSGFFSGNRLVRICASLEGFNLSSESDKTTFLRSALHLCYLIIQWFNTKWNKKEL